MSQTAEQSGSSSLASTWLRNARAVKTLAQVGLALRKFSGDRETSYDAVLRANFERYPDRPALIGEERSLTWRELDEYANRVANWALGEGLGRGDVVALSMENRPEFIGIWLGLSRIGVVSALLNTNLTGERLAHCVREADPRHWIVGRELTDACASALAELDAAPRVFLSGADSLSVAESLSVADAPLVADSPLVADAFPVADAPQVADARPDGGIREAEDFDTLIETESGEAITARPGGAAASRSSSVEPVRANDGLFLIYTSGTTGLPKAAKVSHRKAIVTGLGSKIAQELTPNDRTYCCLPLYHSAGGMMAAGASLFSGGAFVIARRFSAKRFWSDCTQHDVTSIQYIGELCRYLLNSPEHPDERRHQIRSAIGNGLRPEIWEEFQTRFEIGRIVEFYGATEGNLALINGEGRVGAVGHLPHFVRKALGVSILRFDVESEEICRDANGLCTEADFGEAGELVIKLTETAQFEGYTNAAATEKKVLKDAFVPGDAYFRTGDLLRLDEDGFFYFVDRIGDTFRWKGENVATSEIAEVIGVHPDVKEANVYGVAVEGADGRAGMAALVTGADFDLDALATRVERELAPYARPLFLRMLPEMEITGTFKHRKVDLVRDGFDPRKIDDALYFFDAQKGKYTPLDAGVYERITSGQIRL